jgi:hypothetical protein
MNRNAYANISDLNRETMRRIVRREYELTRPVTDAELDDEIAMLTRHANGGTLGDRMAMYAAAMHII